MLVRRAGDDEIEGVAAGAAGSASGGGTASRERQRRKGEKGSVPHGKKLAAGHARGERHRG
jgi:hypothetical protein